MGKLIYLPEGDLLDPFNYSGTPAYILQALISQLKPYSKIVTIETKNIINTEEIWKIIKLSIKGIKTIEQLKSELKGYIPDYRWDWPVNKCLIESIIYSNSMEDKIDAVKKYDFNVKQLTDELISNVFEDGDKILSLNTLNPMFTVTSNCFFYLDISLDYFYFRQSHSYLKDIPDEMKNYYYNIEKNAVLNCNRIFTFSTASGQQILKHYKLKDQKKYLKVNAGINFYPKEIFANKKSKKSLEDAVKFLFVGRDFIGKGGEILIDAFNQVQKTFAIQLTIITDTKYIENLKRFENKNLKFTSLVTKEELIEYYLEHECFIFPTYIDAYGIVVLEALFYGMTVIASDHFAVPEMLPSYFKKLQFKTKSVESLKTAMTDYILNRNYYFDKCKNNRGFIESKFTWQTVCKKIIESMEL